MFDTKKVMQAIKSDINKDVQRRWANAQSNLRLAGLNPDDYQMTGGISQGSVKVGRKDGADFSSVEEDCINRGMGS